MVHEFFLDTINAVVAALWQEGKHTPVWALNAPMGAGKTTLVHALCTKVLQVPDAVSSPTFSIINEYNSPVAGTVYHIDLYRLKGAEEALHAGIEDCLLGGKLCLVEWPAIAASLLPQQCFWINIEVLSESLRRITTTNTLALQ